MDEEEYPISEQEFEEWLKGKPSWAEVGVTGKPFACPVHNFLLQTKGVNVGIEAQTTVDEEGNPLAELPEWVSIFTGRLDTSFMSEMVRAGHCLEVLEGMYGEGEEWEEEEDG